MRNCGTIKKKIFSNLSSPCREQAKWLSRSIKIKMVISLLAVFVWNEDDADDHHPCMLRKKNFQTQKCYYERATRKNFYSSFMYICPSRACFDSETSFNKNLLSRSMFHFSLSYLIRFMCSHIPKESIKTPSLMMILDSIIIKFCFHLQIRSASIKNLFMRFFSFFYVLF